ncbi:hypothetical protein [Methylocystis iwaonis]|uniref:Uncharacterized protein n=1 Tax=Methylocystis iwaonis TaxID=2885079 RepID=A0ABM8E570_9HYPH|nr:hypothetical protein [Methylocystis iwaonis]BDV32980.1 hypothetical protein SS37A_05090 [Methylocystis iwaonis]
MQTIAQLKQMRQEMIDELSKMPEYRAVQAMKKFIDEMSEIYGSDAPTVENKNQSDANSAAKAIEKRIVEGPVENVTQRVRAYSP